VKGGIRKRGATYTWYVHVPDPVTGRHRQISKGGFRRWKECQAALNDALSAMRVGTFVEPSRRTVASFLTDEWLPAIRASKRRPGTAANYRIHVEAHVVPTIGAIELQRLSPAHINDFYQRLLAGGRRDGQPMAPKTVRNIHAIIRRALKDALRMGYVARNVAEAVEPPSAETAERSVWTPEQLRAFLKHVRGDQLYAAWMLFATTGMRRGEVAGLRDEDLDLAASRVSPRRPRVVVDHTVHVSHPKTASGRRFLALDPSTAAALREHMARRADERRQISPGVQHSALVFTWPDGRPIHPARFSEWFERHARQAGLPRIALHDVRHSYATAALKAGVPVKVISERLGHANAAITLDVYSHVIPGMDVQAASTVARLILGGNGAGAQVSTDKIQAVAERHRRSPGVVLPVR
jgi:integrase